MFINAVVIFYALANSALCQSCLSTHSCTPPIGNLVIGRGSQLTASSTCGSQFMQRYCLVNSLTGRQKCLFCQSSGIYKVDKFKHHDVKVIVPSNETQGYWWQSQPGVENVTVTLDLEEAFEVREVSFELPHGHPGQLILQTSSSRGKTWKNIFVFEAEEEEVENLTQIYKPANFYYEFQKSDRIITNVRLNFTKFRSFNGSSNSMIPSFYSISNLVVNGTCFCNGHGLGCQPRRGHNLSLIEGMVSSQCVCGHNAQGDSCDSCLPLYNDQPWTPQAECVKCDCNQRSSSCIFDQTTYDYSGSTSGGVCQDCSENRIGKNCERCKAHFFLDSRSDYCTPCDCFMKGSFGNLCNQLTGQCQCKEGFMGRSCHQRNETFDATVTQRTWTAKGVIEAGPEAKIPFEFTVKDLRGLIRYLTRL